MMKRKKMRCVFFLDKYVMRPSHASSLNSRNLMKQSQSLQLRPKNKSQLSSPLSHHNPSFQVSSPPVFFSFPFQGNNVASQMLWEVKKPKSGTVHLFFDCS